MERSTSYINLEISLLSGGGNEKMREEGRQCFCNAAFVVMKSRVGWGQHCRLSRATAWWAWVRTFCSISERTGARSSPGRGGGSRSQGSSLLCVFTKLGQVSQESDDSKLFLLKASKFLCVWTATGTWGGQTERLDYIKDTVPHFIGACILLRLNR